jgi:hypothetical protein
MSRRRRTILIIAAVGLALLVAGALWFYQAVWVPNRKLLDINWIEAASHQERLDVAHQVLSFPVGDHHDAFLVIGDWGDASSIPYLLRGLRWQRRTDAENPGMACTKSHCLDALKRITGHDAGRNYEDWARWWETEGNNLPLEAFPLRPTQPPVAESDKD